MSIRSPLLRLGVAMLASATVFATATATATARAAPSVHVAQHAVSPAISASQVFANAETWHPHTAQRIPYSFQNWTDGSHSSYMAYERRGGYGTDIPDC